MFSITFSQSTVMIDDDRDDDDDDYADHDDDDDGASQGVLPPSFNKWRSRLPSE